MIKMTKESLEKFVSDPDYASRVFLDLSARTQTMVWKNIIPVLTTLVRDAMLRTEISLEFEKNHPEIKEWSDDKWREFWQHVGVIKSENPNGPLGVIMEQAWQEIAKEDKKDLPEEAL